MSTSSGFGHAPVSKVIALATGFASVLSQASRGSPGVRAASSLASSFSNAVVFQTPSDLLFGSFLLYYFRVLERQLGSSKYGAFVCVAVSVSWALQQAAASSLRQPMPTGPYGLIFASFVLYFFNVPALSKFTIMGWQFTDKAFIYLAGMQLCLTGGLRSLAAAGAGLVAGVVYRSNLFGMRKWKIPDAVSRTLYNTLGRLMESPTDRQGEAAGTQRPPAQAYPAGGGPPGGGTRGTPAPPQVAVSSEALSQLTAMGFPQHAASQALQATNNDVQAAISLLL